MNETFIFFKILSGLQQIYSTEFFIGWSTSETLLLLWHEGMLLYFVEYSVHSQNLPLNFQFKKLEKITIRINCFWTYHQSEEDQVHVYFSLCLTLFRTQHLHHGCSCKGEGVLYRIEEMAFFCKEIAVTIYWRCLVALQLLAWKKKFTNQVLANFSHLEKALIHFFL